jgi:hypothetical protein
MSKAEVHAILGRPGYYSGGPIRYYNSETRFVFGMTPTLQVEDWIGDTEQISVYYDSRGAVAGGIWTPAEREQKGLLDTLRWRPHRWWPDSWWEQP